MSNKKLRRVLKNGGNRAIVGRGVISDVLNKVSDWFGSSHPEAKTSFPGEVLALQKTDHGWVKSNFTGPYGALTPRLRRGDKGITPTDNVSKRHDIAYALARNNDDIRAADEHYIRAIDRIEKAGTDSAFNTKPAKWGIKAKMLADKVGIPLYDFKPEHLNEDDKKLAESELEALTKQGYGRPKKLDPAKKMRDQLIKKLASSSIYLKRNKK